MDLNDLSSVATADLLDRAAALVSEGDVDSDERWAAVTALRRRPERPVFDRAAEWCRSTNDAYRALGAHVLAQLGAPDCPFAAESTPILMGLLRTHDENATIDALYALGHLRVGPTSEIAAFARHPSNGVREATAHALGGRDEPTALDALRLLTDDADNHVRNWATFGLGTLCETDSPEIRDALVARLADEDGEIRGEALVGLARRRDERAFAAISAELAREEVSMLVIEAAELMPSRAYIPALQALVDLAPDDATFRALRSCEAVIDTPAT
jgi:HEAT repeat protein